MIGIESLNDFLTTIRQSGNFLKLEATKDFLQRVPNMHIFTVNKIDINPDDVIVNKDLSELNLPFENIWLDISGTTIDTDGGSLELGNYGIGVWEISPNTYRVITAMELGGSILPIAFSIQPDGKLGLGDSYYKEMYESACILYRHLLIVVLNSINAKPMTLIENTGTAEFKGRIGRVYTKVKCKPSYTIFLQSESSVRKTNPNLAHKIISKPNYAFEVRGHWRRLLKSETLGKNRQGKRVTKGFTWVIPFIKGSGELMRKVRVVKGGK